MNHFYHFERPIAEHKKALQNNIRKTLDDLEQSRHLFEQRTLFFGLGFLAGTTLTLIIYSTLFS